VKISVVVPVYDELDTIEELLARVRATGLIHEIVVVDDASTDGTREKLRELASADSDIRVFVQGQNQGKGAALRRGFAEATGDVLLVQDADLEYDPVDYPDLLRPVLDGRADVVYGSRFLGGPHRVLYFWHYVTNKTLTLLSNMLNNVNLSDMETGYKVFRREALDGISIRSERFGFEPEITAKLARRQLRIYEVPISYSGRTYAEGKKIGWRDGVNALASILYFRFFD
jgi:glycosyltransferase involved in cell wall biosynthesis